jgi:protein AaeX
MLREIALFDTLVPSLLLYFLGAVLAFAVLDTLATRMGIYRLLWHPPLARLGAFIGIFAALVLCTGP